MATIHQVVAGSRAQTEGLRVLHFAGDYVAFVKGAPDITLEYCDGYVEGDQVMPLTPEKRQEVLEAIDGMASAALRVLGVACRPLAAVPDEPTPENVESNLIFLGLVGDDRPGAAGGQSGDRVAKGAGLKSVMVTGDYKDTAPRPSPARSAC